MQHLVRKLLQLVISSNKCILFIFYQYKKLQHQCYFLHLLLQNCVLLTCSVLLTVGSNKNYVKQHFVAIDIKEKQIAQHILVCVASASIKLDCQQRAQNKARRPETDQAALTALSACMLCFVPDTSACLSEWVFVVASNSTNQTNKGGGRCH